MIAYGREAQNPAVKSEGRAMADVIYIAVGILFFVLMGLYAVACDRL